MSNGTPPQLRPLAAPSNRFIKPVVQQPDLQRQNLLRDLAPLIGGLEKIDEAQDKKKRQADAVAGATAAEQATDAHLRAAAVPGAEEVTKTFKELGILGQSPVLIEQFRLSSGRQFIRRSGLADALSDRAWRNAVTSPQNEEDIHKAIMGVVRASFEVLGPEVHSSFQQGAMTAAQPLINQAFQNLTEQRSKNREAEYAAQTQEEMGEMVFKQATIAFSSKDPKVRAAAVDQLRAHITMVDEARKVGVEKMNEIMVEGVISGINRAYDVMGEEGALGAIDWAREEHFRKGHRFGEGENGKRLDEAERDIRSRSAVDHAKDIRSAQVAKTIALHRMYKARALGEAKTPADFEAIILKAFNEQGVSEELSGDMLSRYLERVEDDAGDIDHESAAKMRLMLIKDPRSEATGVALDAWAADPRNAAAFNQYGREFYALRDKGASVSSDVNAAIEDQLNRVLPKETDTHDDNVVTLGKLRGQIKEQAINEALSEKDPLKQANAGIAAVTKFAQSNQDLEVIKKTPRSESIDAVMADKGWDGMERDLAQMVTDIYPASKVVPDDVKGTRREAQKVAASRHRFHRSVRDRMKQRAALILNDPEHIKARKEKAAPHERASYVIDILRDELPDVVEEMFEDSKVGRETRVDGLWKEDPNDPAGAPIPGAKSAYTLQQDPAQLNKHFVPSGVRPGPTALSGTFRFVRDGDTSGLAEAGTDLYHAFRPGGVGMGGFTLVRKFSNMSQFADDLDFTKQGDEDFSSSQLILAGIAARFKGNVRVAKGEHPGFYLTKGIHDRMRKEKWAAHGHRPDHPPLVFISGKAGAEATARWYAGQLPGATESMKNQAKGSFQVRGLTPDEILSGVSREGIKMAQVYGKTWKSHITLETIPLHGTLKEHAEFWKTGGGAEKFLEELGYPKKDKAAFENLRMTQSKLIIGRTQGIMRSLGVDEARAEKFLLRAHRDMRTIEIK